jgi:THO complex subunit 1
MAVSPDPPALQDVAERLEGLLERARGLKNSLTIDPALPAAEFEGERGLPLTDVSQKSHFAAVDVATKRIFQSRLVRLIPDSSAKLIRKAAADIHDAEFGEIWNLLDIIQILCDQGATPNRRSVHSDHLDQCEPVLLWYLIEELLDCQSIEGCRTVFDYLESRGERLVAVRRQSI